MDLLIPEVTIEECAEVIQAITKYMRFGPENPGYDNKKALEIEIGQLRYMLSALSKEWNLDWETTHQGFRGKREALLYYANHNVCNQKPAGA